MKMTQRGWPIVAALAVFALLVAGCTTLHQEVAGLGEVKSDSVVLVGRIEIVPPIDPKEQNIRTGLDPFGTKNHFLGRAIMFLSDQPKYEDRTNNAINPTLEQTYFIQVPKSQRFMVRGSVTMDYRQQVVSRRQVAIEQTELMIPAPIEFDIKPSDSAIYIGTLRLHRDEFNEVVKAEILDDYAGASTEFRKKFGITASLRKALLKPVLSRRS